MLHRLLLLGLFVALVVFALWDIARRNPHLFQRKGGRRGPGPRPVPPPAERGPAGGKVLAFERPAHEVLEVSEGASRGEIEAAYARLRSQWSPEKLADMSDELRALAERRSAEIDRAYQRLVDGG